jgi:tetratricopeptide (TPR) repeat protein
MVNQSSCHVRYGPALQWGIERGDHDYMELLDNCSYSMSADIPWDERDIYRVEQDTQLVSDIVRLEAQYGEKPEFETALELGRLGVVTGRRLHLVIPYLEKAQTLSPENPAPYKYMAIAYVNFGYQHKRAIALVEKMLSLDPTSLFARRFFGYLCHHVGDDVSAEAHLRAALEADSSDCYTITTLAQSMLNAIWMATAERPKEAVRLLQASPVVTGTPCAFLLRKALFIPIPMSLLAHPFIIITMRGGVPLCNPAG